MSAGRFEIFSAVRGNSLSNHESFEFFPRLRGYLFSFRVHRCVGDRVPVLFYLSEHESATNFFAGSTTVEALFARLLR